MCIFSLRSHYITKKKNINKKLFWYLINQKKPCHLLADTIKCMIISCKRLFTPYPNFSVLHTAHASTSWAFQNFPKLKACSLRGCASVCLSLPFGLFCTMGHTLGIIRRFSEHVRVFQAWDIGILAERFIPLLKAQHPCVFLWHRSRKAFKRNPTSSPFYNSRARACFSDRPVLVLLWQAVTHNCHIPMLTAFHLNCTLQILWGIWWLAVRSLTERSLWIHTLWLRNLQGKN